ALQLGLKVTLIETMPGGQSRQPTPDNPGGAKINYDSQYRVANLIKLAIETDQLARASRDFTKNAKRAYRKAAASVRQAFFERLQQKPIRQRFRYRPSPTCDTYIKLIGTYFSKLCGQAMLEQADLTQYIANIKVMLDQASEKLDPFARTENQAQ